MAKRILKWTIKDLVTECIDPMLENKFDCNLFLEGNTGIGKSVLGWKIATRANSPFYPKKDLIYSRDELIKGVSTKRRGINFADELVNVAYKRDFYEYGQKQLVKALNMYRDSENLFIGCIPRFVDLDVDMQGLCKIRITVIRRGFAILQKQISSIYTKDPWDIRNNQKIESKWVLSRSKKPRFIQLTTVFGYLKFGDLSRAAKELYEGLKKEKRNRIYQEDEDLAKLQDPETVFYRNLFDRVVKKQLTPKMLLEMSLVTNRKYSVVRARLNALLKDKGVKTKLKDLVAYANAGKKDNLGFTDPVKDVETEPQEEEVEVWN